MEQALQHMHCHLGLLGRSAASGRSIGGPASDGPT